MNKQQKLSQIIKDHESAILREWVSEQLKMSSPTFAALKESELRDQCREFMGGLIEAIQTGGAQDLSGPDGKRLRQTLSTMSRSRATKGFTPSQTATFVFSLKHPLFTRIGQTYAQNADVQFELLWFTSEILDHLGLYTTECYQKDREEVINRQQEEMLELSTPVIKLWDGVLALPMIGTLDSSRSQVVMETLLQRIMETSSQIAIIDITGVPTVDTLVAQHLMKTVAAARLMGADCIISGVRPQIAQTIVHLAVDLGNITTKATLADAFAVALHRLGHKDGAPTLQRPTWGG